MRPGGGKPATPLEVAQFGHIAAAIRQAMTAKGWKPADLNRAIGRPRAHAGVYSYIGGKASPRADHRKLIAKALGIPEAALIMRRVDGPQVEVAAAPVLRIEGPHRTPQAGPARPVLQFEVDGEGLARIRLDVSLPSADAVPLLRMLLDAGMIMERGESIAMWLMQIVDDYIASEADKTRHILDVMTGKVALRWLKAFDPNAHGGRGSIVMTQDRSEAMQFASFAAVMELWKTQSAVQPLRDDGKPNRPLTAYTIQPTEWRP